MSEYRFVDFGGTTGSVVPFGTDEDFFSLKVWGCGDGGCGEYVRGWRMNGAASCSECHDCVERGGSTSFCKVCSCGKTY
jgi:hypothetical protein